MGAAERVAPEGKRRGRAPRPSPLLLGAAHADDADPAPLAGHRDALPQAAGPRRATLRKWTHEMRPSHRPSDGALPTKVHGARSLRSHVATRSAPLPPPCVCRATSLLHIF